MISRGRMQLPSSSHEDDVCAQFQVVLRTARRGLITIKKDLDETPQHEHLRRGWPRVPVSARSCPACSARCPAPTAGPMAKMLHNADLKRHTTARCLRDAYDPAVEQPRLCDGHSCLSGRGDPMSVAGHHASGWLDRIDGMRRDKVGAARKSVPREASIPPHPRRQACPRRQVHVCAGLRQLPNRNLV